MKRKMIELEKLIECMASDSDFSTSYYWVEGDIFITISDDDTFWVKSGRDINDAPEWQRENIRHAKKLEYATTDEYLSIPGSFEINEYRMIEDFIDRLRDKVAAEKLASSIRGKGAFGRFRDTAIHLSLIEEWYAFRDRAYRKIAIEWCESNGYDYEG